MFAKIENNVIVKYPYSWDQLRDDNPNTSFAIPMDDETALSYGLVRVITTQKPSVSYAENVTEGKPVFDNGMWKQSWNVEPASDEDIVARLENRWLLVRQDRNNRLAESDWTQFRDVVLSNDLEWKQYRQELRDVTQQENPFNIVWPTLPSP